ncbi:hypothetical protein [Oceanobacillus sp. FSL K6-0127]
MPTSEYKAIYSTLYSTLEKLDHTDKPKSMPLMDDAEAEKRH